MKVRTTLGVALVLIALTIMFGCPRPRTGYEYTSADTRSGGWRLPLFGAPDSALEDITDDGGEVREVIEPDVIRRQGDLLFVLNQHRGLLIVDLAENKLVGQAATYGFPRDIYLTPTRAYVLVSQAADYTVVGNTVRYEIGSRLFVVDISDSSQPDVQSSFSLPGDLVDSRIVGDVLYAVSAAYYWGWADGDVAVSVKSDEGSWVTSVNIADPHEPHQADQIKFDGAGQVIHAAANAIYVARSNWTSDTTDIQYIDITDPDGLLVLGGTVAVPGMVADRFKMDQSDGVLRVVSNAWQDGRRVYLTTVDVTEPDALEIMATLDFLRARGDTLFATRFDGDRAYVVTYFLKDPLFVVDLSDPYDPVILGELEVPGWSTHIEPRGDRLIALGVDDTQGWRVSVSLFDVADPTEPGLVERVSFGEDWSWSSAHHDVKAFSVFDDMLAVPFSGWSADVGGYERLQFVSWTPDGLDTRGHVDLSGSLVRSFEHGASVFALTQEELVTLDVKDPDTPEPTARLALAENVADFVPLNDALGVEIIIRFDSGRTIVRTHGLPMHHTHGPAIGTASVELGRLVAAVPHGDSVLLVGAEWPDDGYGWRYWNERMVIARVDCSNPAQPEVSEPVRLDVSPYTGYWGFPMPMFYDIDIGYAMPPWHGAFLDDMAFLVGDKLVVRCTADQFDTTVGSQPASQGLVVLDATSLTGARTVGLGYELVDTVHAVDDRMLIGYAEVADEGSVFQRPLLAHFVGLLDVAETSMSPPANIPGTVVQYDAATDLLTLSDYQWQRDGSIRNDLITAYWNGSDPIELRDEKALPRGTSRILGRGERVYLDVYNNGYELVPVTIGAIGSIQMGSAIPVTAQWGVLVNAQPDKAYVSVGGGALAIYDIGPTSRLSKLVPLMGIPHRIRFGEAQTYGIAGYGGITLLP